MNSVVLMGRLVHDPKLVDVNGTAICSFRLAVDREYGKGEADFINCKAFNKTAENLTAYKRKGDAIALKGRIQTGSYKNKNGDTVYTTDVIADRIEFIGSKSDSADTREREQVYRYEDSSVFEGVKDDIPF